MGSLTCEDKVGLLMTCVSVFLTFLVSGGKIRIDTQFSHLLGKPPVIIARMTPTTTKAGFVSAVLDAGYHVELAGRHHYFPLPPSTLSVSQRKFALSTIRTLKKMKDATPFCFPVDPEALKIPHYIQVVKHPMDFSTIERKLLASNPVELDPNSSNPRYVSADEFVADVRLIFSNYVTFNGPEHVVTQQGKRVEAVFDKQIKQLPPPEEVR
jgi:hypothetical protein